MAFSSAGGRRPALSYHKRVPSGVIINITLSTEVTATANTPRRKFFLSALVVTLSTLILRLLDTVFGVWISNRLGPQGIGLYQLVTSVYGFAVTFSISGLSFAVTMAVSSACAGEQRPFRAVTACALLSLAYSLSAAAVLFFGAGYISLNWLGDIRAALSLKVFAFALPFLAFGACLRGYFIASRKALRSVAGDALEQFARMAVITAFITLLLPPDIEHACCAVVIGSLASELCSFVFYFVSYLADKRRCTLPVSGLPQPGLLRSILRISVPVALGAYLRSALVTAENLLIPRGLSLYGLSSAEALSQYGLVKGMSLPVLLFPSSIIASFALLLVPEVAQTNLSGDSRHISSMTSRALQATFLYSLLFAGSFAGFGRRLGELLYPGSGAGRYIFILAPVIPMFYIDFVVDNLLKALGHQVTSLKFNTIDAFFRTLLVLALLPFTGTAGYVLIIYAGSALNAALSLAKLLRVSGVRLDIRRWLLLPALCSALSGSVSLLLSRLLPSTAIFFAISIMINIILYISLLYITHSITRSDIIWFCSPFRRRLK